MDDLISRQAALDALWKEPSYSDPLNVLAEARDRIKELPSVQPERKKGKWIETVKHYKDDEQEYDYIEVNCSECGARRKIGWRDANCCPNCGVRIWSGEEE